MKVELGANRTAILQTVVFIQSNFKERFVVPTEELIQLSMDVLPDLQSLNHVDTSLTPTDLVSVAHLLRLTRPNLARIINTQRMQRGYTH